MSYEFQIKERPVQPVLSIRTRSSAENLPQILGQSYCAIAEYLGELGEQPVGPPFAGYFNMDMQDIDVEIGFPVAQEYPSKDFIVPSQIPSCKAATCIYTGPYTGLEPVYNELLQWVNENNYEPTGVVYEFYLNDPAQTPPEELQTEIVFLLKS